MKFTLAYILVIATLGLSMVAKAEPKKAAKANGLGELKYVEGDETGNEKRAVKAELLVAATEKKALQQIKMLLGKHKGTHLEPELWFRLAELHMRRSKTERFFELNRQSDTIVDLAPKVVRKASSKREIVKAVNVYERIQRRFPKFMQMDLVIFNNAFARQQLNQNKTAEKLYFSLIKKYPQSPLVPDSHLAIGELNFNSKKFKHALEHFLAIEQYPNSRVFPYGVYKAAWSYYNLRQALEGLNKLEDVVAYLKEAEKMGWNARLDLRREALADMTIFYEDVYPAKDAFDYFAKQAGNIDMGPFLLKLGYLYERHSRYEDKHTILTTMLSERPYSVSAPEIHDQLVLNFENREMKPQAIAQMENFYKVCEEDSRWVGKMVELSEKDPQAVAALAEYQAPKGKSTATPADKLISKDCAARLQETSLILASKWLRAWKKNQGYPEFADAAERGFDIYLRRANADKEGSEARFAFAELLFQRKKYRLASDQYFKVASTTDIKMLGHDSGYAALLSLEKAVGAEWNRKDEDRFQLLAKHYIEKNPKGKYRLDIKFKLAMISYEQERYEEAGALFLAIGDEFPKTDKGLKAQDLYLDILNIQKDYVGLVAYSTRLLNKGLSKDRQKKLKDIYEQASFLQVQELEDQKKYDEAIVGYQKFAQKNPSSKLAEVAVWNATELLYKQQRLAEAAKSGFTYYEKYPKNKKAQDALLRAAQTYETVGNLEQATKVLEELIKVDKENALKWKRLHADFLVLTGKVRLAKLEYKKLCENQDHQVAVTALDQLKKLAELESDTTQLKVLRKQFIKLGVQPQASMAKLEDVEDLFEQKKYSEAFIEAKKVLNMGKTASTYARSKARFLQARILEDEFVRQSVKTRAERVALVLAMKTEKLEKAQRAYQSAMRYGDPKVAVMAMKRLAGCYKTFVEHLLTMPVPKGLTAADVPMFRSEISQLSIPLEEKGVEAMANALEKAKDLKLRDGTIAELREALDEMNLRKDQRLKWKFTPAQMALPVVKKGMGS
jgi:TolA-binding protein